MADDQPRISVVVPSYNRASFLPGCVRSLRECGVAGLEIVIVDDGSTDDTRAVVESLQPGLTYVYQENKRLPGARNTGIRASRGRYIAYLDSDDYWLPGVPERMADLLDRHPELGLVFADARMGNPEQGYESWYMAAGGGEFSSLPATEPEPGLRILEPLPLYRLMLKQNPIFTGAMMLRREVVLDAGMFDETLVTGEDWEVWLRLVHRVRFGAWHEPMAIYTKHDGAMTANREFMQKAWCEALLRHARQAPGLGVGSADRRLLRAAIRRQLFGYAYTAYDRGDYRTARERFGRALRDGPFSPTAAALWAVCALPNPLPRLVRRVKQVVTG